MEFYKEKLKKIENEMQKLREINELKEVCLRDCEMLSKALTKEIERYNKLEEKRKEILTQLDILTK